MRLAPVLRSPRRFASIYLAAALAAVACLAWLGWRLLDQERLVEAQRARERLELASDRAVRSLQHGLSDLDRALVGPGEHLPAGVVRISEEGRTVRVTPAGRLVFVPVLTPPSPGPPDDTFRAAETLEFADANLPGAIAAYRAIARSSSADVRAEALLRAGRALRKARGYGEALAAYDELERLAAASAGGRPADLVAREARCSALEEIGDRARLQREAAALGRDLAAGRWALTRAQWEFASDEAAAWAGTELAPDPGQDDERSLAEAADEFWSSRGDRPSAGQVVSWHANRPVVAIWRQSAESFTVVLAGGAHLDRLTRGAAADAGADVALLAADGRTLAGRAAGPAVDRQPADTGLPFGVRAASADVAGDPDGSGPRRRLLIATLVLVGGLMLGSLYATVRGINRELAAARLQSDFVSAVSHEFRTPLTSLRQFSQMLAHGRVVNEDRRQQYYDVLVRESERLHRLVERLLAFGRAQSGAGRYRFDTIALDDVVRAVVEEFRAQAPGVQIEVSISATPCIVRGDADLLAQALWNLLDNAAKYSPECPTIWVDLGAEVGHAQLAVRDSGPGIPAGERERIFAPFVRGSQADTAGVRGTGIGLALVRHIAEAHGGEIRLESEVGGGSTFTLRMPLGGADAAGASIGEPSDRETQA